MAQDLNIPTDWLSAKRVAAELGMNYNDVLAWAKRQEDPLPARCIADNKRQWRVRRCDMDEWIMRNSTPLKA